MKFHAPDEWNISDNFMFEIWSNVPIEILKPDWNTRTCNNFLSNTTCNRTSKKRRSPISLSGVTDRDQRSELWNTLGNSVEPPSGWKWMKSAPFINGTMARIERLCESMLIAGIYHRPCSNRVKVDTKHDVTSRFISLYSSKFLFARRLPVSITRSRPLLIRNWEHSIVRSSVGFTTPPGEINFRWY